MAKKPLFGSFDRSFPGAQSPNGERPQYSAPEYGQIYDPNGAGYRDPGSVRDASLGQYQGKMQQGYDALRGLYSQFGIDFGGGAGGAGGAGGGGGHPGAGGAGGADCTAVQSSLGSASEK